MLSVYKCFYASVNGLLIGKPLHQLPLQTVISLKSYTHVCSKTSSVCCMSVEKNLLMSNTLLCECHAGPTEKRVSRNSGIEGSFSTEGERETSFSLPLLVVH